MLPTHRCVVSSTSALDQACWLSCILQRLQPRQCAPLGHIVRLRHNTPSSDHCEPCIQNDPLAQAQPSSQPPAPATPQTLAPQSLPTPCVAVRAVRSSDGLQLCLEGPVDAQLLDHLGGTLTALMHANAVAVTSCCEPDTPRLRMCVRIDLSAGHLSKFPVLIDCWACNADLREIILPDELQRSHWGLVDVVAGALASDAKLPAKSIPRGELIHSELQWHLLDALLVRSADLPGMRCFVTLVTQHFLPLVFTNPRSFDGIGGQLCQHLVADTVHILDKRGFGAVLAECFTSHLALCASV
jgi:hypothetical protein